MRLVTDTKVKLVYPGAPYPYVATYKAINLDSLRLVFMLNNDELEISLNDFQQGKVKLIEV